MSFPPPPAAGGVPPFKAPPMPGPPAGFNKAPPPGPGPAGLAGNKAPMPAAASTAPGPKSFAPMPGPPPGSSFPVGTKTAMPLPGPSSAAAAPSPSMPRAGSAAAAAPAPVAGSPFPGKFPPAPLPVGPTTTAATGFKAPSPSMPGNNKFPAPAPVGAGNKLPFPAPAPVGAGAAAFKQPLPAPVAGGAGSKFPPPPVAGGGGGFAPSPGKFPMPALGGGAPSPSPAPNRPPIGGPLPAGPGKLPLPPGPLAGGKMPLPMPINTNTAGIAASPMTPTSLSASSPIATGTTPQMSNISAPRFGGAPPMNPMLPPQQQQQPQQQHQHQPFNRAGSSSQLTSPNQQQQPLNAQSLQAQQQQQQQQAAAAAAAQQQQQAQQQAAQQQQQAQQQAQQQQQTAALGNAGRARMRAKPQGQNRIDSLQMPSPCRDLIVDGHPAYKWPPAPFATDRTNTIPPTTASGTPCIDEGNAMAKFVRPTMHQLPWEEEALRKTQMPFGAVLSPLCSKTVNAQQGSNLPVIHRDAVGSPDGQPLRCSRCRAYMSAWNPFTGTGHGWNCGFCGMANDVTDTYFSPIASGGKRRDYLERPELSRGSYEVDVTDVEKYWAENPDTQRPIKPRPMNHLFIIDVSRQAAPTLKALTAAIRDAVSAMPGSGFGMCNVSFVTYATTLHFYDFTDSRMPQLVVADTTNPFVPLPFNMLCWLNVETQRDTIDAFLDRLESQELIDTVDETGCVLGAAAKVGQLILADIGGKVILTGTSGPTEGAGKLAERDVGRMYGNAQTEKDLFKPQPGFWPTLAVESAKRHVSFDLYLFPFAPLDLVTLGQLSHMTNGKQWVFYNFHDESDGLRLKRRVFHALNDEAGYGAILRTRCSAGIRVKAYHGHYTQTDPQDMDLAGIDSSSHFFVELVHDGKLDKKSNALIQIALLYTSRAGRRRVRVHTLRQAVSDTISNIFRFTDLEATLYGFICLSVHEAFNKGVKAAREFIIARTVDLLVGYRVHSQTGSHSGQLLLPENLKLLPLYNLCLMKSDALAAGTVVRFEDRVQNMFELLSYPQDRLLMYLYPRLFALHSLPSERCGEYKIGDNDDDDALLGEVDARPPVFLPPMLQLTADNVYQGGIYLLQDLQARIVFLLIGSQVQPSVLMSVFGVPEGQSSACVTQQSMNEWNPRVRRIVQQMMDETGRLVIVREKAGAVGAGGEQQPQAQSLEDAFFRNLLEDQVPNSETCYSEFLCVLHRQINQKAK